MNFQPKIENSIIHWIFFYSGKLKLQCFSENMFRSIFHLIFIYKTPGSFIHHVHWIWKAQNSFQRALFCFQRAFFFISIKNNIYFFFNFVGNDGPTGLRGLDGLKGIKGDRGLDGFPGERGDKGDAGLNGAIGYQGLVSIFFFKSIIRLTID